MSLSATDSLNIIGYYGEMELPLAEKKVRIVMSEQLQGTVEKYYDTVRTILSDDKTSKRKKDILLAAAVLSLKNAYLSIFDKYYSAYINAAGTGSSEPYSGSDAWKRRRAYDFALWITQTAQREPNLAFSESHAATVTRTEVNAVCNLAAMDAAYRQGKRFKTWKTFGDLKVRPTHKAANGQRVPLDMPFTVGGYEMMFPNDSSLGAPAGEVVNCRCVLEFDDGEVLTNSDERDIIGAENNNSRPMAHGGRRERSYELTEEDIEFVKAEAESIGIPTDVLRFNEGTQTGFWDDGEIINIRGDIFPDTMSTDNRDLLSVRATLAHEYYGHYKAHPSRFSQGDWRDEFAASYNAALNAPNLSDEDRTRLIIDAYDRAKAAGFPAKYNKKAREIIYGKEETDA